MNNSNSNWLGLCALLFTTFNTVQADVLKPDDVIVPGHMCVGLDCPGNVDGGGNILFDFQSNTLIVQENNTRIRFVDTSAADVLGQSWQLSANATFNTGPAYFRIEMISITQDTVQISDGTGPLYDCSVPTSGFPAIIGTTPAGSPVLVPQNPVSVGGGMFMYSCETQPDYTYGRMLSIANAVDSSVTLGIASETIDGTVSVGNPGMLRNLKHVAAGIADSNVLIKQMLDDYTTLPDQRLQVAFLSGQLAMLEDQIEAIEDEVFPDSGSSGGSGSGSFSAGFLLFMGIFALINAALRRKE